MNSLENKFTIIDDEFIIDDYMDLDTKNIHHLIIYKYKKNDNVGYHNLVIGEVLENDPLLVEFLQNIIDMRKTNSHLLFIYSCIKAAKEKNLFENINFSKDGYNFIFPTGCHSLLENCRNNISTIIIDPITKRFSSIFYDDEPFKPISYFENETFEHGKVLKKVING